MEEFEELPGYSNIAGMVKSNPKNNKSYLETVAIGYPEEWYTTFIELDRILEVLVPGYNISQIKEKFQYPCYYINFPEGDVSPKLINQVQEIISIMLEKLSPLERKKW